MKLLKLEATDSMVQCAFCKNHNDTPDSGNMYSIQGDSESVAICSNCLESLHEALQQNSRNIMRKNRTDYFGGTA